MCFVDRSWCELFRFFLNICCELYIKIFFKICCELVDFFNNFLWIIRFFIEYLVLVRYLLIEIKIVIGIELLFVIWYLGMVNCILSISSL